MYKWSPSKWLKWAPVMVGLPVLASVFTFSPDLWRDTQKRAGSAVPGLKVEMDARDAIITGEVTSQDEFDAAVKAVAGTYGVRNVEAKLVTVPPVKLQAPTLANLVVNKSQPEIQGQWPEGAATTLAVTLAGKTYSLGKDAELTSANGTWSLKPSAALPDGVYDLGVTISDGKKASESANFAGAVVIDTVAPAAASLSAPAAGAIWPYAITGTWPEAEAKSLTITLKDKTYSLGTDASLTSDGNGTFTFDPKVELAPGSYDLKIESTDAVGNVSTQTLAAAIVIPELVPAPAVEPVAPAPAPVVETQPVTPPTIAAITGLQNPVVVSGTWDKANSESVKVDVAGKSYDLNSGITTTDGTWSLTLPQLADGTYDVAVTVTDKVGQKVTDSTKDELVIDTTPAPRPTINAIDTADSVTEISGTFGGTDTKSLRIAIPAAHLNSDVAGLSTDGDTWRFTMANPLPPGFYDVEVQATDAYGRIQTDNSTNEITVVGAPAKIAAAEAPKVEAQKPVVLSEPTVDKLSSDKPTATLTGTWQAGVANALTVSVAGTTYTLGQAPYELLSDASGKWKLNLPNELKNGIYDVVVKASSADGQSAGDATVGELEIAVPPPPEPKAEEPAPAPALPPLTAPTVNAQTSEKATTVVTGTWTASTSKSLTVTVNNETFKLGQVPYNLLASTDGKWKLTLDKPLANGTYDVVATVTDGAAASVSDATQGELVINVPEVKPAEPAPASVAAPVAEAAEPYDCEAVLGKISKVFPIRFEFARTKLVAPYDLTVNQYTSLLKDPRCATMKVEIEGHADYIGPVSFNQFLSDLRAEKLRTVLVDAGIDPARLSTKGFSEMAPLDPQKTVEARAKNRRVEFHSVK